MATRLVISASPRAMGKSARVAEGLAGLLRKGFPEDDVSTLRLADLSVAPCIGCNTCKEGDGCFMDDGMARIDTELAAADVLYVVSPVYFSGPPANYKAVLDRFQPHFWTWERGLPKRDAHLVVLGDGGDPNGFEPLVVCTRSALAVAGFRLVDVHAYIGVDAGDAVAQLGRDVIDAAPDNDA